ncbi:MAG: DsbA family protein [Campylobacteraceae bacterium]|jgi:protein-disulfide isomerase|nr:DsbA family protein [Campylobacteraceae bacterium]
MNKKTILIFAVIIVATIAIAAANLYKSSTTKQQTISELLVRSHSPIYGNKDAKVTLVEFFDPACETCAQFAPLIKEFVKNSDGKLRVVYRYAPLHKNSDIVVTLLELAKEQKIPFDKALNTLLFNQNLWVQNHTTNPELATMLLEQEVGFDVQKAHLDINTVQGRIEQDIEDMNTLNINKTPSFFVNGKPLQKFGYNELKELIDREIKRVYE